MNVPEVKKWLKGHNYPHKALHLLDNAPGPSSDELMTEDKCITAMLLSSNCTALIPNTCYKSKTEMAVAAATTVVGTATYFFARGT
ncbi:hypothetical protein WA026_001898 [Henosepilachna vigintioctopunctata]|uniref:Uncharacterized protein n=1 Tax=Henosepilachna vigintioctopunctata TaxID=420089 RepID=A0AAW1UV42_9CUCU